MRMRIEQLETRAAPAALPTIFPVELAADAAVAGEANDDLATPADVIHPNIHANNNAGNNANPNGRDNNGNGAAAGGGGGNMHGIANNPGQSGDNPGSDGVNGFANELATVHGGIGTVNQNVD